MSKEHTEVISSLRQQSIRLSRVINELLDYSQIETGNIKLNFTWVKPEDVIELGITALVMQAAEKNIHFETEIEENLPEVRADLEKVVFVFGTSLFCHYYTATIVPKPDYFLIAIARAVD